MSPAVRIAVTCSYCSKPRNPNECAYLPGGVIMCWHCYQWHQKAMAALAGKPPPGCQECGVAFGDLQRRAPDGNTKMYVHVKDGLYQILCETCSDQYARKRRDLYGKTPWARKKQIL